MSASDQRAQGGMREHRDCVAAAYQQGEPYWKLSVVYRGIEICLTWRLSCRLERQRVNASRQTINAWSVHLHYGVPHKSIATNTMELLGADLNRSMQK